MDQEKQKFYDAVVNITIVNFFTLAKKGHGIIIIKGYKNTPEHKCILKIAEMSKMIGIDVKILLPWYKYLFYIKFGKNSWCKRVKSENLCGYVVDLDEFIAHMESANNYPNLYYEIYNAYYKRR